MTMFDKIFTYLPRIHKEGYTIIALALFVVVVLFLFSSTVGWIGVLLSICICLFFRDPIRVTPIDEEIVVSPADGIVTRIDFAKPPVELGMQSDEKLKVVSIFLSVFDVHVTRIPVIGVVTKQVYHPGQFVSATLDKSSDLNERNSLVIQTADGQNVIVTQIAGLIARRIVSSAKVNAAVVSGEHYGIIKFGSRVDLYLPVQSSIQVSVGQRMVGGETIIADLNIDGEDDLAQREFKTN